MTIEALLERIAVALENRKPTELVLAQPSAAVTSGSAPAAVVVEGPAKVTRRRAEKAAADAALVASVAEADAKAAAEAAAPAAEPAKEDGPQMIQNPTLEDVRMVILACRARLQKQFGNEMGAKRAVELLKEHGGGAPILGQLDKQYFSAVIKAAGSTAV